MNRRTYLKLFGALPFANIFATTGSGKENMMPDDNPRKHPHLVIYGATPGGIACAIRAAREGLKVSIVNHTHHLGGMFINGLGTMDTLYNGARAPVYDELRFSIYDYYRKKYGTGSAQFEASNPRHPKTRFESHVVEHLINEMVAAEPLITVIKGYCPVQATKAEKILKSVTFRQMDGDGTLALTGDIFADCSYEADLAAVAEVDCRIGRESRNEFGEKHAGVIFMEENRWPPSEIADRNAFDQVRRLNLYRYEDWSEPANVPESTGEAHEAIQAFNIRTTLTDDPDNRIIPDKPENYNPDYLRETFGHEGSAGLSVPNRKTSWNQPELIGEQNKYVEGDWPERQRIYNRFRDVTLGLLYFMQNDESVPEDIQNMWREFGLPKDEYRDNGYMPYEIYVRESRRIVGRTVFTENDASLAEGLNRAPVHSDSISATEWFMDSHACTDAKVPGSKHEGEVMLKNMTFPGQVPLRSIFPQNLDNLMVPVCLSASHIGWGTIRLEPVWMGIGEVAGHVAALAVGQQIQPASVDSDKLVRLLARKHIMVSFFNDIEGREYSPWYAAVQYLGTQGFFGTYDAMPDEKLTSALADAWLAYTAEWIKGAPLDATSRARVMLSAEQKGGNPVKAAVFAERLGRILYPKDYSPDKMIQLITRLDISPNTWITRGDACRLIFEATA